MTELRVKINVNSIKWVLLCFLLLGNLLLLAKNDDDLLFIIIWEIAVNGLAIGSFILLSFLPRLYYIFNDNGVSYQNRKGKEYVFIPWHKVENISYGYIFGVFPDGLEIRWNDNGEVKKMTLSISVKQFKEVYCSIQAVSDIVNTTK